MKKPTAAQVKKEIETLEKYRNLVRPYNMFGESNEAAIEAQIMVLERGMSDDDIDERSFGDERLMSSAQEAVNWREGKSLQKPSIDWKPLLIA